MEDRELLEEYTNSGSERAFNEIVMRYTDMVYAACLRQLHDPHLAEDAVQAVFVALAGKARTIIKARVLSGWLLKAANFAVKNTRRAEIRRKKHEKEAAEMNKTETDFKSGWEQVSPVLDEALMSLNTKERNSIALRFFQKKKHADIGIILGVSEDTARKRVANSLKKLRKYFSKKGITLSAVGLSALISENGVFAAPEGLAANCISVGLAGASGGAVPAGVYAIAKGMIHMMTWAQIKITAVVIAGVVLLGAGIPVSINIAAQDNPADVLLENRDTAAKSNGKPGERTETGKEDGVSVTDIRPKWKGRSFVLLFQNGHSPAWSPDGRYVACCLPVKRERSRGHWNTSEGGIGVIEVGTGRIMKASLRRGGSIDGLVWMPNSEKIIAAGGKRLWSIEVADNGLKSRPFAAKVTTELTPEWRIIIKSVSPDGTFLLCYLRKQGRDRNSIKQKRIDSIVFNKIGKRVALFNGNNVIWSPDSKKVFFTYSKQICELELPHDRKKTLFSSDNYFKNNPPKTYPNWSWVPCPVAVVNQGKLLIEIEETPDPNWRPARGIVVTKGRMAVWGYENGKNVFTELGSTKQGIHGEITYTKAGRDTILRVESTEGYGRGDMIMRILSAETGKTVLNLKPPATARYGNKDVNLKLRQVACSNEYVIFSGTGHITRGRVGRVQWFGFFTLDLGSGIFRQMNELPFTGSPRNVSIMPEGKLLLTLECRFKHEKSSKYYKGVWLCDPGGSGLVLE